TSFVGVFSMYTREMLFRLLKIRKMAREVKANPGLSAAEEASAAVLGLIAVPILLIIAALVLFFILGNTTLLGSPTGFFRVLFWIAVALSFVLYAVFRPVISLIRHATRRSVEGVMKKSRPAR